jgi:hypothetical protein
MYFFPKKYLEKVRIIGPNITSNIFEQKSCILKKLESDGWLVQSEP